jgi:hypothetical protein
MQSTDSADFLHAANPKQGRIDVFDRSFHGVTLSSGAFVDPLLPAGLVPFNVEDVDGDLYVAYAKGGPPVAKTVAPEGSGAIAVFDTSGNFIKQLTSGRKLASPWGITLALHGFGEFSGALLVGNFSYVATEINAFDPVSGAYLGTLADSSGNTLLQGDNGLWDLTFGNRGKGGLPVTLYFTSGLNAESDGLLGAITPTPRPGIAGSAGQESNLEFLFSSSGVIEMAGNPGTGRTADDEGSGVMNNPVAAPPPEMAWGSPAAAPSTGSVPRTLATLTASPHHDLLNQLFATLPSGADDAAWIM